MEKEKETNEDEFDEIELSSPKSQADTDLESKEEKKYPYPKSIGFIISTEFCERFSYYGMKSKNIFKMHKKSNKTP